MIIIRMTPGFANAIMKYCAAYALSRELGGEEIVIDIGSCQNSAWGYLVDFLNIPDYKKITYYTLDSRNTSTVPDNITDGFAILKIPQYSNITQATKLQESGDDLYLDDWFMDQLNYYDDYMNELRPQLTYRGKSDNIEAFKSLIKGRVSVGVHFRRTDMLYADFAQMTEDDYYKAAIEYCKATIDRDAIFCVFSDDIQYAENLLGRDDSIRYIHFVGYDDADVEEFICLSLCDHRIRPKTSSYSDLADRINGNDSRICILQGELKPVPLAKRIAQWKHWTKRRVLTSVLPHRFQTYRDELKRYDFCRDNYRILDRKKIDKYSPRFESKEGSRVEHLKSILNTEVSKNNANNILEMMREYELNYMTPVIKDEISYRYKKFQCFYLIEDYEHAVGLGDNIWGHKIHEKFFCDEYSEAIRKAGYDSESKLVNSRITNVDFMVFSNIPSVYSGNLYGLGELSVGLAKMGGSVAIVESPANETEEIYVKTHENLTNRHEVCLGCKQFMYSDAKEYGYKRFIGERFLSKENTEKVHVIITKDPEIIADKIEGIIYIWSDYLDEYDPESNAQREGSSSVENMIESADYILTCHPDQYDGQLSGKMIVYDNASYQTPYWETTQRWKQYDCHRLSQRTINMCMALRRFAEEVCH